MKMKPPALALTLPVALTLLSAVSLLAGCTSSAPAVVDKPTPVGVAVATDGPAQQAIVSSGIVASRDEMRLSFKVGGVVRSIPVQEGQRVRKGQRLAEIELAEVGAQVEQARQLAQKAQRDRERGERLYADQVISLEQLQDLKTQASVTQAGLRSAQFNLGYSSIVAPRDGVVLRKLVEARELVPAGQPVVVLGASDSGYVVKLALADRDVVQLKLGDTATIGMDAYPGREFTGKVREISGAADERTGLFPIEIAIEPVSEALASGLVAKVSVTPAGAAATKLTYVPMAALVEGDRDRAFVFVVVGQQARRRTVRVAFMTAGAVALAEGLASGETVVTDGALYLEDQERIQVVKDASQAIGAIAPLLPAARSGAG